MNRKPLVIGITAGLLSCCVLLAIVGIVLSLRLLAPATAQPTVPPTTAPRQPTATAGPTPAAAQTPALVSSPTPSQPSELADAASLHALLNANVRERDPFDLTRRFRKVTQPIPTVVNAAPPRYQVGDQRILWIADEPNSTYFTTTATLRYITPHVYAWVQNGTRIDLNALRRSTDAFENKIYPTVRQFFGGEWSPGIDNDVHVNVFNGNVPGVAGYYSSSDEYPRIVNQYSNEGEWFYISISVLQPGTTSYESVLAHEFQHMVHWNNDKNEDIWVNEGMAELATKVAGYSLLGHDRAFVNEPDTQLNAWRSDPNDSIPHYGAAYLFNAYFLERFGEKLTQEAVREPANGIAGYDAVLERNRTGLRFVDLFQDWVVANVLNNTGPGNGRYAYRDLRTRAAIQTTTSRYPFAASGTVQQFGSQYVELRAPVPAANYTLTFQGSTSVPIANTTPRSGQYVWYSNRGDQSSMWLSRAFDLRSVPKATLAVSLWYTIETDYDYAYAAVSTDNGVTWDTLKSARTTDSNPNGNNFGHGLTGDSHGWIEERFDLTPYAGKQVLIRFEYMTDDAVNMTGMLLDDITIPELGYRDDVESGEGGWQADGFVRVNNRLPQRYSVQLVKFGEQVTVEKVPLDDRNRAQVSLAGFGGDLSRVIVVINGLTPVTTEPATFTLNVAP